MHFFWFCRNMDLIHGSTDSEFDAILAEMEEEMSLGDIVKELGYGCTFDVLHCKEILSPFLPLTEVTISKILGTIARNLTGLEDNQSTFSTFGLALGCNITTDLPQLSSWDIDVLVKTIKQLVSSVLFLLSLPFALNVTFSKRSSLNHCIFMLFYRLLVLTGFKLLKTWIMKDFTYLMRRHSPF